MDTNPKNFTKSAVIALKDIQLQTALDRGTTRGVNGRIAAMGETTDADALRRQGRLARERALNALPDLLEQLERNVVANGGKVLWARDGDEANQLILDLCKEHNVRRVSKGKSMPSSRDDILKKLRDATATSKPFTRDTTPAMIPATKLAGDEDLAARFTAEVERVKGVVHPAESEAEAMRILQGLLGDKGVKRATMWDQEHIDLQGIEQVLSELDITRVQGSNEDVATADVGITGCDWAIAATGTLVLSSGEGMLRYSFNFKNTTVKRNCAIEVNDRYFNP